MRIIFLIVVSSVFCLFVSGQQYRVTGYVYDQGTGKPVDGCYIVFIQLTEKISAGTTDESGLFSFKIAGQEQDQSLSIQVSHLNYAPKTVSAVTGDSVIIYLEPYNRLIEEVTIYSSYRNTNKGNEYVYTPLEAMSSISVVGEPDVIRHISSMPGVSQGMEGTLGLFVRGSNNGSNSIVFNRVPVYASSHLGLFSAFPPDVIRESSFYLGGTPAANGNFSSSLVRIDTKKHYGIPFQGKFTLSPYLTGGYVSLPLVKERISMQASGRTTFLPFFLNQFVNSDADHEKMKAQLLDFTVLADGKINERNIIDMMFHTSNDYLDYRFEDSQNKLNWGTNAFKLEWNSQITSKLKSVFYAYYSTSFSRQEQIYYDYYNPGKQRSLLRLGTEINEFSTHFNLSYCLSDRFSSLAGFQYQYYEYVPLSEKTLVREDVSYRNKFDSREGHLSSVYLEMKYTIPEIIATMIGFRNSLWRINKKNRWNSDLHILSDIFLNRYWGVELAYDRFVQYYHVLEGLPVGWSHNVTTPADNLFPEEITNQFFAGGYWKYQGCYYWNVSLGGFYRKMVNMVSYINSSNLFGFTDVTWQDEVDTGTGLSYGLELSTSVQGDRIGTTLAYTLSKSEREFPGINEGVKFPFKFDRRHILNLQAKYTILERITRKGKKREQYVTGVISYSTGNRATLPVGTYQGEAPPYWELRESGLSFPFEVDDNAYSRQIMSHRNEFRMKDYFRIDLAYTFTRYGNKVINELSVSVFNILNRKNPYLYYRTDGKWYQLSIVPVMPSIRWSISF